MVCSPARLAANRANAARSTGPVTPEGRRRSSMNSYKHGLTGAGIVLPNEDAAEVERRSHALFHELAPKSELARMLVGRIAFLSARLERSQRYDVATLSKRVRHAEEAFTEERLTLLNVSAALLGSDPDIAVRRLRATPEGIDWLLARWDDLRQDLITNDGLSWGSGQYARLEDLLGRRSEPNRISRNWALTEAVRDFFPNLDPAEVGGMDDAEKKAWARREILAQIDANIADLEAARQSIDLSAIEQDRAEAVDRVLFDPSKEATLARKYEAATERSLYRALREFRELNEQEAEAEPEVPIEPDVAPEPGSRPRGTLASSFRSVLAPVEVEEIGPDFANPGDLTALERRAMAFPDDISPRIE